jgi:putative endonuclease
VAWLRRDGRTRQRAGSAAEDLALTFLTGRGLVLVERNHRCRQGEIDLVMRDGDTLVFVEVRLRGAGAFASAAESVDAHKQRRIVAAARHFLAGRAEMPCRFDCVLLDRIDASGIEWVRSAFEA